MKNGRKKLQFEKKVLQKLTDRQLSKIVGGSMPDDPRPTLDNPDRQPPGRNY